MPNSSNTFFVQCEEKTPNSISYWQTGSATLENFTEESNHWLHNCPIPGNSKTPTTRSLTARTIYQNAQMRDLGKSGLSSYTQNYKHFTLRRQICGWHYNSTLAMMKYKETFFLKESNTDIGEIIWNMPPNVWQEGKRTSWLLMSKGKQKFYCSLVELWVTVSANKWPTHEERLMSASGRRTSPPCQLGCLTNNKSLTETFRLNSFHTLQQVQCVWGVIFTKKSSDTSTDTFYLQSISTEVLLV